MPTTAEDAPPSPASAEGVSPGAMMPPAAGASGQGVIRAQAADGADPLPPAILRAGQPSPDASAGPGAPQGTPFIPPTERLSAGPQAVGLSLDIQAPAAANLNKETWFKILVKNNGPTEALGVLVRDNLPPGLQYLDSDPKGEVVGSIVTWKIGDLPAGAERVIKVRVKAVQVGSFDHAAVVTVMAGSRTRVQVKQPKLKVEQAVASDQVLKGRQVRFDITVTNDGNGPARDVVVEAKLSPGLRHEQGDIIQLSLRKVYGKEYLASGESLTLQPLIVEAIGGGPQTCEITATSPDVSEEAKTSQTITVIEPRLEIALRGDKDRAPDTLARYTLTLANTGTAPARKVKAVARIPSGGTLEDKGGGRYDPQKRYLYWYLEQIEPNTKQEFTFTILVGSPQIYQIVAAAIAQDVKQVNDSLTTQVMGVADVQFSVVERRRILDPGDETDYEIRIINKGSKEATNIQIRAKLSENLSYVETAGTEQDAGWDQANREVVFPQIPRLAARESLPLTIRVKAEKSGPATCSVTLTYDGLNGVTINNTAYSTVMQARAEDTPQPPR
ncbi:MAG: DUF11 domain-containing protein [Isosphaeraceae bacterium]|nr:DUF11 domain-containing protein [Isosphaeraceae bacterium]